MNRKLSIITKDGFELPSILYEPEEMVKGSVLLCPGLGIPKEFYGEYCSFLAQEGYTTLIFDYRGIGNNEARKNEVRMNLRNWGIEDIPVCLDWLNINYPNQKIIFIGHSVAGQIAGLAHNFNLVDRFIFISSTGGHRSLFGFPMNLLTWFMFHLHIPITSRLFGHMPPSLTYRGVAIAKNVALEWARWSRKKDYISAFYGREIPKNYYSSITQSIDWISFEDDAIATHKAVEYMMSYYENAKLTKRRYDPKKEGLPRVGHAGFFRKKLGSAFWKVPLEIIEN